MRESWSNECRRRSVDLMRADLAGLGALVPAEAAVEDIVTVIESLQAPAR
jgi:hypothetical protein